MKLPFIVSVKQKKSAEVISCQNADNLQLILVKFGLEFKSPHIKGLKYSFPVSMGSGLYQLVGCEFSY